MPDGGDADGRPILVLRADRLRAARRVLVAAAVAAVGWSALSQPYPRGNYPGLPLDVITLHLAAAAFGAIPWQRCGRAPPGPREGPSPPPLV